MSHGLILLFDSMSCGKPYCIKACVNQAFLIPVNGTAVGKAIDLIKAAPYRPGACSNRPVMVDGVPGQSGFRFPDEEN